MLGAKYVHIYIITSFSRQKNPDNAEVREDEWGWLSGKVLPGSHSPGFHPQHSKRWRQDDQLFKVTLSYTTNKRPAWLLNKQTKGLNKLVGVALNLGLLGSALCSRNRGPACCLPGSLSVST